MKNKFRRSWPAVATLAFAALIIVLVASSTTAQALDGERANALQSTPPALTVPALTPQVTVVVPTVIIPNTGGNTVIVDLFSNWVLLAILGAFVIVLLIALVTRPTGPAEPHHHHDV